LQFISEVSNVDWQQLIHLVEHLHMHNARWEVTHEFRTAAVELQWTLAPTVEAACLGDSKVFATLN
jgi:hypothetical protein